MGNFQSSCFKISISKTKTAKLFDFHGNLRKIQAPVKAAELMLEVPGSVISPVDAIRRTGRLVALRAEDELLPAKVYLLVPLERVNHRISESEIGILESLSVKTLRKRHGGAKVLPVEREVEQLEDHGGFSGGRLAKIGAWTPVLEPISEDDEQF